MDQTRIMKNAGAPGAGTAAVHTLTIGGTPDGGTFRLAYGGQVTAAITWTATDATLISRIQTALRALTGLEAVVATAGTVTSGIGTVVLTYTKSPREVPTVDVNSLTGTDPTVAVAETTPGVSPTPSGAGPGQVVSDITNKILYINTGTLAVPIWTKVGTQS